MDTAEALRRLREREADLRKLGIERLSIFGSVARGDAGVASDVDLAASLDYGRCRTLLDFVGLQQTIAEWLDIDVDLVTEPSRKPRFQAEIDRDRIRVF